MTLYEDLVKRLEEVEFAIKQIKEGLTNRPKYSGFCDNCGVYKIDEGICAWLDHKWLCKECLERKLSEYPCALDNSNYGG